MRYVKCLMAVLCLFLTLAVSCNPALAIPISYDRSALVPDFGQHSDNWCWVAATANSAYYLKNSKGASWLYDDSALLISQDSITAGSPWFDSNDGRDNAPTPGYSQLMEDIAKAAGKVFSQPITADEYFAMKKKFFHGMQVKRFDDPSLDIIRQELADGEDVELFINRGSTEPGHVITLTSYEKRGDQWWIDFKDSWNWNAPAGPDHNTNPNPAAGNTEWAPVNYDPVNGLTFTYQGLFWTVDYAFSESVPEPGTMLLVVIGISITVGIRRRLQA
jgi:hypothetical protein